MTAGDAPARRGEVATQASPRLRGDALEFVPGQPDMWFFVLIESLLFTAYFTVYLVCRLQNPDLYLESQAQLDLRIGAFNTLVLLASSWSVARCVQAAREGAYPAALRNVSLTMLFGGVFVVSKVMEWASEIQKGFTFTTNEFFTFYYFLTGIHFLHVLIGFVVLLAIVVRQIRNPALRSQVLIETGATYWHTVDFLWIIIFSLLYVMR